MWKRGSAKTWKPIKCRIVCHYFGSKEHVILRNSKWSNILILQRTKINSPLFPFSSKWQTSKICLYPESLWTSSSDRPKYSVNIGLSRFWCFNNNGYPVNWEPYWHLLIPPMALRYMQDPGHLQDKFSGVCIPSYFSAVSNTHFLQPYLYAT